MTDNATVLCKRCGFANAPGDQFCGSCGAFLEWEGQADGAGAPAAAAGPASAADVGLAGLVRPAQGAPGTPATAPTPAPAWTAAAPVPAPAPVPAAPPAPSDAGLLRCPACGIANAGSRTFCQSCGATLTPAARVAGRSAEEVAAAVNAVAVTHPVPPAAPGVAAPRGQAAPKKGGIAGWVVAVIVVGIVAGVGFVAVSTLLKGNGPAPIATTAPSQAVVASPSANASAQASARTSSAPSASSSPVVAGKPLKLTGAAASSVLGDQAAYLAQNAIDGNPTTSWQEGSDTEKGQWIEVSFAPSRVDAVVIRNGYGKSTALFKGNLRPKDVQVSIDGGTPVAIRLKDTPNAQKIALGPVSGATNLRITIVSTYPSVKTAISGTPFQDAAISEISVIGAPGS
jgi:hypothetical protein